METKVSYSGKMADKENALLEEARRAGIIPVFYDPSPEVAWQVLVTCYGCGLRVFELADRGEDADEVFRSLFLQKSGYLAWCWAWAPCSRQKMH